MDRIGAFLKERWILVAVAFAVFWTPVIIFLKLAGEVVEGEQLALDIAILKAIHVYESAPLDTVFHTFTTIGDVTTIIFMTLVITAFLYSWKQRRDIFILLAGVGGAAAANVILKLLFHRTRPSLWHSSVVETSFSFPSGHAMLSSAFIFCLIVILWKTKYRWITIVLGLPFVVLVGLSRLYFGVHYPSDIVAGWSVSLAWVVIVTLVAASPQLVKWGNKQSTLTNHTS